MAAAVAWPAQYTEPLHFSCAWQAQYTELSRGAAARWPFCVAGALHRAFWRSCGAVAAAGPRLPFAWQAQYTEPPHFPFAWRAQYIELPGGAAARWPPRARGCLLPGRRSTQSLRTSLVRSRRSTQNFLAELRRGGRH